MVAPPTKQENNLAGDCGKRVPSATLGRERQMQRRSAAEHQDRRAAERLSGHDHES